MILTSDTFWFRAGLFLIGWFIGSLLVSDFSLRSIVTGAGISLAYSAFIEYFFNS